MTEKKPLHVLIVDDEPLARQRIADMLRAQPDVLILSEIDNGNAAVEAVRTLRPDLVAEALRGAPQILFAQLASAAGQAVGLLFGPGDGEARFSDYELNEHREFDPREA